MRCHQWYWISAGDCSTPRITPSENEISLVVLDLRRDLIERDGSTKEIYLWYWISAVIAQHGGTRQARVGGPCRDRTYGPLIKSQLLYQLS